MIDVKIVDNSFIDEPLNKSFKWNITEYRYDELLIQLEFEEPINVSFHSQRDDVEVLFKDTRFLFDKFGQELKNSTMLSRQVPPQFASEEQAKAFAMLGAPFKTIETGSFSSDVILNAIIAATWQQILQPIASHQIIIFFALYNVSYPPHVEYFCRILLEIAAFDMVPADEINGEIYKEKESEQQRKIKESALFQKIEGLGFEEIEVMLNLSSTFVVLILQTIVLSLTYWTSLCTCCCRCCTKRKACFRGLIFWNLPLNFVRDTFSVLALCSLLNVRFLSWETY